MSIPYMNKLEVFRKISPPLGPPAPGSPAVETRGPVIAIEGSHAVLMQSVRPIIERALRGSGECEVRLWMDSSVDNRLSGLNTPPSRDGGGGATVRKRGGSSSEGDEDVDMKEESQDKSSSRSSSGDGGSLTPVPPSARRGTTTTTTNFGGGGRSSNNKSTTTGMFDYLQTIMSWHARSAEIIKHITTKPSSQYSPIITSPEAETKNNSTMTTRSISRTNNYPPTSISRSGSSSRSSISSSRLLPVALIPGGFSLTLSDRFASTVAITDPYSPVDHWQWMATLWRGIVGADLVIYVQGMTPDEVAKNAGTVEYRAPGIMVVRVVGGDSSASTFGGGGGSSSSSGYGNGKIDEKTERRLAFEVMEWVRAGSFRDGYDFGGGSLGGEGH